MDSELWNGSSPSVNPEPAVTTGMVFLFHHFADNCEGIQIIIAEYGALGASTTES